jgi:cyanophycinase
MTTFTRAWRWSARLGILTLTVGTLASCATRQVPDDLPGVASTQAQAAAGSLIIVGGGPRPPAIMQRFVELAGGPSARILVMPMATAVENAGERSAAEFTRMGVASAASVHLTRELSESDTIARIFDGVTGIWFLGGQQSRVTRAMQGTAAEHALHARYRAGAVIGGTSAGAAIMTTPMITGSESRPGGTRPDSTADWITIDRDNVGTAPGLSLLPGAIVDQHFLRRKRHNRLISLVLENPTLIGAGIDESTALEVRPDGTWRVLGNSVVVIYDARRGSVAPVGAPVLGVANMQMHVLPNGATFDPRTGRSALP